METLMSKEEIYRNYLGDYFVKPIRNESIRAQIKGDISGTECVFGYQVDGVNQFKQVVSHCILSHNRHIRFMVYDYYRDIVEKHLNPEPGEKLVNSLCEPDLLVIYFPKEGVKNKLTLPLCLSIAESRRISPVPNYETRRFSPKKTVFITFKKEPEIEKKVRIVKLSDLLIKGNDEIEIE